MPRKVATISGKSKQLSFTLPAGARRMLDQLVAREIIGDSHSSVIATIVTQYLLDNQGKYGLTLATPSDPATPMSTNDA